MHTNDNSKVLPEGFVSDNATIEAYRALKGLYPKSNSETRKEDMRNYHYLYAHIHDANQRLTFLVEDLEKMHNRTFMEKLKDLFSK